MTHDTTTRTHDELGVLIVDDERDQLDDDDPMIKALTNAYRLADAVRDQTLPIEVKSFPCQ